jgi:hypothetical protein
MSYALGPILFLNSSKGEQCMKNLPEYTSYDALGLAELVRKGEVTATELCETAMGLSGLTLRSTPW